jgi:transcriptional regulator with XRE-family HTH domain
MRLERETFGPVLRAARERRGLSLHELAVRTKVRVDLWGDLEDSDLSRWPARIYARAYVRDYATRVGLDADHIVNEFCRLFPEYGDRRADSLLRSHADIVQHELDWQDEPPPTGDRRATDRPAGRALLVRHLDRIVAVGLDVKVVVLVAGLARLAEMSFWPSLAVTAVLYHAVGVLLFDRSAGAVLSERFLKLLRSMRVARRLIEGSGLRAQG